MTKKPRSGYGHTSTQVKCFACINDIAGDPAAPVARIARVIKYTDHGLVYLCVSHAVLDGYSGRLAPEKAKRGTS